MTQPYQMTEVIFDHLSQLRASKRYSECHYELGSISGRLGALFECGALELDQYSRLCDLARNAFSHAIKEASK